MKGRQRRNAADDARVRVDAADWVAAGLAALAMDGIDAVRVEPVAKKLGVTKGSFYWHFKDRPAWLAAILESWRQRATHDIINRLEESSGSPKERLHALLNLSFSPKQAEHGYSVDLAVRMWARKDPMTAAALTAVDDLRVRYFARLLVEAGLDQPEAEARACLAYSLMRVAPSLENASEPGVLARCEALLLTQ